MNEKRFIIETMTGISIEDWEENNRKLKERMESGKMKETIAQRIIRERKENGQKLLGETRGLYSFRKGSNLTRKLEELGLTENDVDVHTAARAGQYKNDGWQLLIFSK